MVFPYLLAAFIAVPIIEIWILLRVGGAIGGGTTILIVIFTAVLGAYLVRQQGFATLTAVQKQMDAGRVPAMEMAEGLALLVAGAVLLTPGFVTDAFGFLLLTPPIRRAVIHWFLNRQHFTVHTSNQRMRTPTPGPRRDSSDSVIEGEFKEHD
jgi:UPF0716 protein FxsA